MTSHLEPLIVEMDQEAAATRRMLERVPVEKLGWKPHDKSMSLGQLALHVAGVPGSVAAMLSGEGMDVSGAKFDPPSPASAEEILSKHDESLNAAKDILAGWDEKKASAIWRLTKGDTELMAVPRLVMARTLVLNHWYHHRGQLSVYLRMLDVPLPVTYGRTADENPFA